MKTRLDERPRSKADLANPAPRAVSETPPNSLRVAVLGAGSWGTALAAVMRPGHAVRLWARDDLLAESIGSLRENRRYLPGIRLPDTVEATSDLRYALDAADAVVYAIPSAGMAQVATAAAPYLQHGATLVNAAKGLEEEAGRRMSELISSSVAMTLASACPIVALSGPNLAMEVAMGLPTATVAASLSVEAQLLCRTLWMSPTLRVYTSRDIVGVELAGAMKNVIAIGAGICEGMGYGDNSRAALMTRGLAEITRLGVRLGAEERTFLGLAGVGDLIATSGSRLSRNYRVGLGLGEGRRLAEVIADIGQVAEGVPTTRAICRLAGRVGVDMPVSRAIHEVVIEGAPVADMINNLMRRPPRDEGA